MGHEVDQRISCIVYMQKLAPWCARAPNDHFCGFGNLSLMRFAYEGGHYVATVQIEIVAGPIKIGGHRGDEVATKLLPIGLTEFEPSNFRDGIPFVSGLKRSGKQSALGDRLLGKLWIDTRGAE